jgi:DNA-binding beta-propeller fold protein YncE
LVVTEKATNLIDVFPLVGLVPGPRVASVSHGMTPFGFAFGNHDRVFVSEAFGGAPNASAASSYSLLANDMLHVISGSVGTTQTAACWLVIDPSGRFAYTTNTGSRTVSVFGIGQDGSLTAGASLASTPAGGPIDATFSAGGRFLHVLTANAATIVTFRIQSNGSLQVVGTVSAPPAAAGLAAQ